MRLTTIILTNSLQVLFNRMFTYNDVFYVEQKELNVNEKALRNEFFQNDLSEEAFQK